jgi:hypothetical protein
MIPFYGNLLTPHVGCIQMAITVAAVIENVCMSRHFKAEFVAYGTRLQPLPRFTHLLPLNADCSSICPESVQHLIQISKFRSYQTIGIGHISNQWKAEFITGKFHVQSFWGGHGNFLPNS